MLSIIYNIKDYYSLKSPCPTQSCLQTVFQRMAEFHRRHRTGRNWCDRLAPLVEASTALRSPS